MKQYKDCISCASVRIKYLFCNSYCIVFAFAIRKYCIKGEPSLCDGQHIDSYIGSMKISHMIAGLVQGMNI